MDEILQDNTDVKSEDIKIIGKFKPKRPFLNFVAAVNGTRIRLISDFAFIKGEKLSGILEGTKLKFTIRDNNTLDVEEIGSSKSDDEMIKRLIDDIDSTDVTGYAHKFIVNGLEFENDKGDRYYLEVEYQKPYDRLKSIFDEPENTKLSDNASSFLDQLLSNSSEKVEIVEEETEDVLEDPKDVPVEEPAKPSYLEESFKKMNEQKVTELKSRIEEAEKNINKFKRDITQSERSISSESDRLTVLQTRLETFNVKDESIGYFFQVSDAKQSERELNDVEKALLSDVAKIIKADENMLTKLLSDTMFVIKLGKKDNFEEKTISKEAFERLKKIDSNGTITLNSDGDIEYRGKMNWHQVVDKLIKRGFEQDAEFEKFAGSNSYEVEKEEDTSEVEKEKEEEEDVSVKVEQTQFKTYDEPKDLVKKDNFLDYLTKVKAYFGKTLKSFLDKNANY